MYQKKVGIYWNFNGTCIGVYLYTDSFHDLSPPLFSLVWCLQLLLVFDMDPPYVGYDWCLHLNLSDIWLLYNASTVMMLKSDRHLPWAFLILLHRHLNDVTRKPVFGVCDQGRLEPVSAVTEARQRLKISGIETRGILSRQRTTKALIRLCECTGWSAPLLFAYGTTGFLMMWLICSAVLFSLCTYWYIYLAAFILVDSTL